MNSRKQRRQARRRIRRTKRRLNRKINNVRRTQNRLKRRVRRTRRMLRNKRAQLTEYKEMKSRFKVLRTDDNSTVVTGVDLIYSVPDTPLSESEDVMTVIPSNPAYWTGTRVAAMALAYQQFRPLRFTVHYSPYTSVLQQGTIFGGTIWENTTIPKQNLQKALTTTSGKMNTQAAQKARARVPLGRNLGTNLYNVAGELNYRSNPFFYVAVGVGNFKEETRIGTGMFWVSYKYVFRNPVGNNTVFENSGLTLYRNITYRTNTTAMLCQEKVYEGPPNKYGNPTYQTLNPFTILQINLLDHDYNNGETIATYNGEVVPLQPEDKLWVFSNYPATYQEGIQSYVFRLSRNVPNNDGYLLIAGHVYLIDRLTETELHRVDITTVLGGSVTINPTKIISVYDIQQGEIGQLAGKIYDNYSWTAGQNVTYTTGTITENDHLKIYVYDADAQLAKIKTKLTNYITNKINKISPTKLPTMQDFYDQADYDISDPYYDDCEDEEYEEEEEVEPKTSALPSVPKNELNKNKPNDTLKQNQEKIPTSNKEKECNAPNKKTEKGALKKIN